MTAVALPSEAAGCLSEEDLLAFASGQLSHEVRERAHRHLDICEACQQLLSEAVHALATARSAGVTERNEAVWSTTFRPGMLIGQRYVIRRFIARGGMGEVYEALDQALQERVALKTVTATASDDPNAVRRLKAEVQLARRVSHPNVCRIYDFGTHRASTSPPLSFLTMEFVEGETLGVRLRRSGALPLQAAISLASTLLHGLQAAHTAGVLHRDFKSDNVMLRGAGQQLEPLILDFGLARAFDRLDAQSSTSQRGVVGTFAYMAPEQLEGEPYTPASDIYSFGLVWYEMLTGELPFKTRSSPAMTTIERLTKPVPAPSTKNAAVFGALDALVLACLRRSPRERPQNAGAVLARLEQLGRLEQLEHQLGRQRSKRLLRSLPAACVLLAAAALALQHGVGKAPHATSKAAALAERRSEPAVSPLDPDAPVPMSAQVVASQPLLAPRHFGKPGVPSSAGASSKERPKLGAGTLPPAPTVSVASPLKQRHEQLVPGWENPFVATSEPPSTNMGAVLEQPLYRGSSARHSEFPEGGR